MNKIGIAFSLLFGVTALSTSAIFVRLAAAPSAITAFYRLFFAMLALLPFFLLNKETGRELRGLSKKQWFLGVASGVILAAHYILWFESLRYTSVASATVIVTLQPLFAMSAGALLFRERFHRRAILGCLIAIAGCILIGWGDFQVSGTALFGDALAFIAAGIITAYFFIGRSLRKGLSVVSYSVIGYASSSLSLAAYALLTQVPFVGYPAATWHAFLGLALIATVCGQFIFNWLLRWVSATVVSMTILGETVGTCILAYFILHEAITLQQGIGIFIILSGLALFFLSPKVAQ